MKIYWIPAQAPMRVLALIKHLGVDVELIRIDPVAGGLHTPEYKALNPNRKAPTLVDGDLVRLGQRPRGLVRAQVMLARPARKVRPRLTLDGPGGPAAADVVKPGLGLVTVKVGAQRLALRLGARVHQDALCARARVHDGALVELRAAKNPATGLVARRGRVFGSRSYHLGQW